MRTLLPLLISLCFLVSGVTVHAQNACSNVSCDCKNLPLDSWKSICKEREKSIASSCSEKNNFNPEGFCSIHGPAANRIPLSINLDNSVIVAESEITPLNYKIAILYWSLHKDLDLLQQQVNRNTLDKALDYASVINTNTDHLFNVQKQVVNSYMAANNEPEAQKSWRDYSTDTLKVGHMLYDYGKAMLNAADAQKDAMQKEQTHKLAFELLSTSSRMYEQAGYAYANGVRHALAAKTWKEAAGISETLMRAEPNKANANLYRQQAAMRLHKASYYHVLGQGENDAAITDAEKLLRTGDEFNGAAVGL